MSPQRVSDTRKAKPSRFPARVEKFEVEEDTETIARRAKDLGLSQIDSTFAIGQAGGVVVVMHEFHNESAQDTGDFVAVQSKFDKRKQAQLDREEQVRLQKLQEKQAALALKRAEEAREAQIIADAKAAADAAAKKEADEKKEEARKLRVAKAEAAKAEAAKIEAAKAEASKIQAAKVEAARVETARLAAAKLEASKTRVPPPGVPSSIMHDKAPSSIIHDKAPSSIMHDSAVVGVGNVINNKKVTKLGAGRTAVQAPPPAIVRTFMQTGVQTDPVRILPLIDEQPVAYSSYGNPPHQSAYAAPASVVGPSSAARPGAAAAAWWLQQQSQQPQQQPTEDAAPFVMYPGNHQTSNYYYQNNEQQMYWQNAYQTAPPTGRFPQQTNRR